MRKLLWLVAVGMFGAAVAVLPGLATASNPSVTASNFTYTPTQVTIGPGGSVDFSNAGGTHDVHFTGAQPSSCSGSTGNIGPSGSSPSAPSPSSSGWSGTCTFNQAGSYAFECDLHHFTGTINVSSGTTTTNPTTTNPTTTNPTTTNPTTTNPTTTTPTTTTPTGGNPGSPTTSTPTTTKPGGGPTPSGGGSAPSGSKAAASSLALASTQHGGAVRGSVTIAADHADFEADLVGTAAQIARSVTFGRTTKRDVPAGKLNFVVALNGRARAALARRHRLRLRLVVKVKASGRTSTTLSRRVTLRA